jgi:hypothetical protein
MTKENKFYKEPTSLIYLVKILRAEKIKKANEIIAACLKHPGVCPLTGPTYY